MARKKKRRKSRRPFTGTCSVCKRSSLRYKRKGTNIPLRYWKPFYGELCQSCYMRWRRDPDFGRPGKTKADREARMLFLNRAGVQKTEIAKIYDIGRDTVLACIYRALEREKETCPTNAPCPQSTTPDAPCADPAPPQSSPEPKDTFGFDVFSAEPHAPSPTSTTSEGPDSSASETSTGESYA